MGELFWGKSGWCWRFCCSQHPLSHILSKEDSWLLLCLLTYAGALQTFPAVPGEIFILLTPLKLLCFLSKRGISKLPYIDPPANKPALCGAQARLCFQQPVCSSCRNFVSQKRMSHLFRNWGLFTSPECHSSCSKTSPGSVKYLSPSGGTIKMRLVGCRWFYFFF